MSRAQKCRVWNDKIISEWIKEQTIEVFEVYSHDGTRQQQHSFQHSGCSYSMCTCCMQTDLKSKNTLCTAVPLAKQSDSCTDSNWSASVRSDTQEMTTEAQGTGCLQEVDQRLRGKLKSAWHDSKALWEKQIFVFEHVGSLMWSAAVAVLSFY